MRGVSTPVMPPYLPAHAHGPCARYPRLFSQGLCQWRVSYDPKFLLQWDASGRNVDRTFLKQRVIDIRQHLRRSQIAYQSLRELCDESVEEGQQQDSHVTPPAATQRPPQAYRSAFRILGEMGRISIDDVILTPDASFTVEHDLNPSPAVQATLTKLTATKERAKHKNMAAAYQAMHDAITEQMPQVPLFSEWFELLKVVAFAAHYAQTLREMGIVPTVDAPSQLPPFPRAMPPIPVRKIQSFAVQLTLADLDTTLDKPRVDALLQDILLERQFSLESLQDHLHDIARMGIKQKLRALSCGDVDDRDDNELKVGSVAAQLTNLFSQVVAAANETPVQGLIQQMVDAEYVGADVVAKQYLALATQPWAQRLKFATENIPTLANRHFDGIILKAQTQTTKSEAGIRAEGVKVTQEQLQQVDGQRTTAVSEMNARIDTQIVDLHRQGRDAIAEIDHQVASCPPGHYVDATKVQQAKDSISTQLSAALNAANSRRSELTASIDANVVKLKADVKRDVETQVTDKVANLRTELASQVDGARKAMSNVLAELTKVLSDCEKDAAIMCSKLFSRDATKNIPLLPVLRLWEVAAST